MSEEPKKEEEKPKEDCPKEGGFGFHGFGPRCHWKGPGKHCHKERKCECGEVIPKRKEGEPKIKVCPKCGKDLPKKKHGFGMRCHKMKKWMKFMYMMNMMNSTCPSGFGFGPGFNQFGPPFQRGLEVHHYIHFGPPTMGPPGFGRPPMMGMMGPPFFRRHMGPPGFGRPPMMGMMGPPPFFGRHMGPPGFGRPPMGPPPFGFLHGPHGPHGHHHGPHGSCEKKEEQKKE